MSDPSDSRLALYRAKLRRDPVEYPAQARALAMRALGTQLPAQVPLRRMDCVVGVHYGRECLQRLRDARRSGRDIVVHSVLLPEAAAGSLAGLAEEVCADVFEVSNAMYEAEFQREGSDHPAVPRMCSFVVAYPVQRPLRDLRPPFLVFDGTGSPENVGQILRTAFHLGVCSVVASRSAWNNLIGRAARVSMGWVYHMDFHLADPLEGALRQLRSSGVRLYAAEPHFAAPVRPHAPRGDRCWALVVGHEAAGISAASLELSHARVRVPQRRGESLNVAHACAICLYELSRDMDG